MPSQTADESRGSAAVGPVLGETVNLAGTDLPTQLTELLEEAIIHGALLPGQRLRGEELALHYGVSRIPVREALRSLEAAGWVEIRPRYGASVRMRSLHELRSLFDVRSLLEGHAAGRAAQNRNDSDLRELRQVVRASREAVRAGDDAALSRLGGSFYAAVREAAHNPVLSSTLMSQEKRARFYFSTVEASMGRDWVRVHESIAAAIEGRETVRARRLAKSHIEETGLAVERLLRADNVIAGSGGVRRDGLGLS